MKLLVCIKCSDVFSLRKEERKCSCGLSTGKYVDNLNAEFSGPAEVIGFVNSSFIGALADHKNIGDRADGKGREFTAFVIPKSAASVKRV